MQSDIETGKHYLCRLKGSLRLGVIFTVCLPATYLVHHFLFLPFQRNKNLLMHVTNTRIAAEKFFFKHKVSLEITMCYVYQDGLELRLLLPPKC